MSVAYGEQQRHSAFGDTRFGASAPSATPSQRDLERQYHVVLQDSLGHPALGFRDGTWFRLTVSGPQALQLRGAIRHCPHAAGSIVQIACWWMRENPLQPRSLDLATELALTVGELVRVCPSDGLGSSGSDLLAMPMTAPAMPVQQALPPAPVAQQPAPQQPAPQPAFAAPMAAPAAPAATGSWFDPADTTGTGGFPAIPPAPVMGQSRPAAAPAPVPSYQQARTPYPPAPQGYGSSAQPQAALPAASTSYQTATAPAAAPRAAAPRGYGEQNSDWDRPAAPSPGRRAAPQQPQAQPQPPQPQPRQGVPPRAVPNANGGSGPQPRPRPQQARPEFRDERRDPSFDRRPAEQDLSRSSDRLDRSGDRIDPRGDRGNGVPPRRPAPQQQQRGTMGRRPATRPGRQSDW
jgi:hypothetical protein